MTNTALVSIVLTGLLGLFGLPHQSGAGSGGPKSQPPRSATAYEHDEQYTLDFVPTQNASPGTRGTMDIKLVNGATHVHFSLRGGQPNTVYTIWIVFNRLVWPLAGPPGTNAANGTSVLSTSAAGRTLADGTPFPPEGNAVSPLAPLGAGFTDGMGLDPGATFISNDDGDGEVSIQVDYDLIRAAPVGNKNLIMQCAPAGLGPDGMCTGSTSFGVPRKLRSITTTWLRRFIGAYQLSDRASACANYNPRFDPDNTPPLYNPVPLGIDSRLWQCIDPATVSNPADPWTGRPRVPRFEFDHFRLAPHPDALTHGLIGGNATDHFIEMVGRRVDLSPSPQ